MRVAVLGTAGFIGSNLTDALVEKGYDVLGIDNFRTGKREYVNPKIEFIQGDIRNKKLSGWLEGIDTIFHTAALARIQPSVANPEEYHDININGTFNVLQASLQASVRRIIYSSSSSAYGEQNVMPETEDMLPRPLNPYATQKLVGEYYMKTWANCYQIDTVSLRYFNVYGQRQATEGAYSTVISIFLKQKSEGLALTIAGDGKQKRSFTHVDDVVDANIRAMTTKRKLAGEIINIGCDKSYSINEVAKLIGGKTTRIAPRPFEVRETLPDISKAYTFLKWRPKLTLEEGISRLKQNIG